MAFGRPLAVALSLVLAPLAPAAHAAATQPKARPNVARHADDWFVLKLTAGNRFDQTVGALKSRAPGLDRALARIGAREAIPLFPPARADLALRGKLGLDRVYVIRLDRAADIHAVISDLSRRPDVEVVERPAGVSAAGAVSVIPNDAAFPGQWSLRNTGSNLPDGIAGADIKATDAWEVTTGDSTLIVAVLDSGILTSHPDLAARLWTNTDEIPGNGLDDDRNGYIDDEHGYNFAYNSPDINDYFGHGTAVSSIVGAVTNNGIGMSGINWACRLMPVGAIDDHGFGEYIWVAEALYYAVNNGARVVNMSLAGEEPSNILQVTLQYAAQRGCFVAAAMGNDGSGFVRYPARYPEVLAVGATDGRDARAFFSSFGEHIGVVAPGVDITVLSAFEDSTVFKASGTSVSTPMVAGLASLILAGRTLRPEQVRNIIEATADDGVGNPLEDTPGWDVYHGYGRINCDRALRLDTIPRIPVVQAPEEVSGIEGSMLRVDVSAFDPNGEPLLSLTADLRYLPASHTASFVVGPDGRTGTLTWTPSLDEAGRYVVRFMAADPLRGFADTWISVANLNQAPRLAAPQVIPAREEIDLLFLIHGTDPDNDLLTLTAPTLPAGARFYDGLDNSGTLLWRPAVGQAGPHRAVFLATDDHGASATATTDIQVGVADRPPVIDAPAAVSGDEGSPISFGVSVSDPDGEAITSLTMDLAVLPAGHSASFAAVPEGGIGAFSWTPGFDGAGVYHLVVIAANAGRSAVDVILTVGDVDRAPSVAVPPIVDAQESAALDVLVEAIDPDGDPIRSLTAGALPEGATFETDPGNASGHVRWTPRFDQAGVYQVMMSATSAPRAAPASAPVLEGVAIVQIRVANSDRAPQADAGGPYAGALGAPIEFDGSGSSDPDGDALQYLWSYGDGNTAEGVHAVHIYRLPGEFTVTLRVDDGLLTSEDVTSASITGVLPATAFLPDAHSTISLVSGSSAVRLQLEPVDRAFAITDLDLASLRLTGHGAGEVTEIAAVLDKTTVGVDRDRDGVLEVSVSFRRSDLRLLFSNVKGRTTVEAALEGALTGGAPIHADVTLTVVGGIGGSTASLTPNPLRASGTLIVRSARDGPIRVRLFDCHGRLVRTLMDGWGSAGFHEVAFDGLDADGTRLATGVYFVRAETPAGNVVERVTIVK